MGACHSSDLDDGSSSSPLEAAITRRLSSAVVNTKEAQLLDAEKALRRRLEITALLRGQRRDELHAKFCAGLLDGTTFAQLQYIEAHRKLTQWILDNVRIKTQPTPTPLSVGADVIKLSDDADTAHWLPGGQLRTVESYVAVQCLCWEFVLLNKAKSQQTAICTSRTAASHLLRY